MSPSPSDSAWAFNGGFNRICDKYQISCAGPNNDLIYSRERASGSTNISFLLMDGINNKSNNPSTVKNIGKGCHNYNIKPEREKHTLEHMRTTMGTDQSVLTSNSLPVGLCSSIYRIFLRGLIRTH